MNEAYSPAENFLNDVIVDSTERNTETIKNLFVLPTDNLPTPPEMTLQPDSRAELVAIQTYFSPCNGKVEIHTEENVQNGAVDEYYVPLTGAFEVTIGQETKIYSGVLDEIKDWNFTSHRIIEDEHHNVLLELTDNQGIIITYKALRIPSGTIHGTKQVDNKSAAWLAIKISRPEL
jgi:hypothetical protein